MQSLKVAKKADACAKEAHGKTNKEERNQPARGLNCGQL
jgi:hypothetical protein